MHEINLIPLVAPLGRKAEHVVVREATRLSLCVTELWLLLALVVRNRVLIDMAILPDVADVTELLLQIVRATIVL